MGVKVTVGAGVIDGADDIDGRSVGAAVDGTGEGTGLSEGACEDVGGTVYS